MFIKLDMIDNQVALTNLMEWRHDDVISDDTPGQFRLELSIFWTCEYNNSLSLHAMFTKLDMVDNQQVLTNFLNYVISNVTVDLCRLEFNIFRACDNHNLINSHSMFTKLDMVDINHYFRIIMNDVTLTSSVTLQLTSFG